MCKGILDKINSSNLDSHQDLTKEDFKAWSRKIMEGYKGRSPWVKRAEKELIEYYSKSITSVVMFSSRGAKENRSEEIQ